MLFAIVASTDGARFVTGQADRLLTNRTGGGVRCAEGMAARLHFGGMVTTEEFTTGQAGMITLATTGRMTGGAVDNLCGWFMAGGAGF